MLLHRLQCDVWSSIAASSLPESFDLALRRSGLFERLSGHKRRRHRRKRRPAHSTTSYLPGKCVNWTFETNCNAASTTVCLLFLLVEASCKSQLQPHQVMKAAAAAAKATRRKIFAYLLLFFRSVVQLISAQCAPVAHFHIHLQWGKADIARHLCDEGKRTPNLLRLNK